MFQTRQAFAINTSDRSIEAVELTMDKGVLALRGQSSVLLESGVVEDGRIVNAEKFKTSVRELLKQAQPQQFSGKDLIITIPESRVFAQTYSLPKSIGAKDAPSALFSQARETLPLDPSQIVADYRFVGSSNDFSHYLFSAVYTSLLQEYLKAFESVNLKVTLATMESLALAAATLDEKKDETVLVLDIGSRTTIASVFRAGELQESININIAGNNLTAALSEKLKISTAEAEERKMTIGLKPANGDGAELLIMQGQLQPLKDELSVFVKFYEEKMQAKIDRIMISGGTASLRGIDEYFAANLGLPTGIATALPVFSVAADRPDLQRFLIVLGLARIAFGDRESTINFLEHHEKDWLPTKRSIKSIEALSAASESPAIQSKPKKSRKNLVYALILFLAVLLLAGVVIWKKYGGIPGFGNGTQLPGVFQSAMTFVIRPAQAPSERTLTFSFTLAQDIKKAQKGDFAGTVEHITSVSQVPFKQSIFDDLRRSRTLQNGAESDEAALVAALPERLAEVLWEANRGLFISEKSKEGKRLLDTVMKTIVDQELTKIVVTDGQLSPATKISVIFDVPALADQAEFSRFENEQINSFTAVNPDWELSHKDFSYTPDEATSRIRIIAAYSFIEKK